MSRKLSLILVCLLISGVMSCAKKKTTISTPIVETMSVNIKSIVSEILPKPGSSSNFTRTSRTTPAWFIDGWVGYSIFKLFGDPEVYDPDRSIWGVENISENLELVSKIVAVSTTALTAGSATIMIGTEEIPLTLSAAVASTALDVPYTPGLSHLSEVTYDYQRTITFTGMLSVQLAWKKKDGINYVLLRQISPPTSPTEYNFMTFEYNETTKNITLNRACRSESDDGGVFLMRIELLGNRTTKNFTMRAIKRNDSDQFGNIESYLAAGNASESIATNHYILKVKFDDGDSLIANTTEKYYCFLSSVSTTNFSDYESSTSHDSTTNYVDAKIEQRDDSDFSITACQGSDYTTTVDGLSYFTEEDLPTATSNWSSPLF